MDIKILMVPFFIWIAFFLSEIMKGGVNTHAISNRHHYSQSSPDILDFPIEENVDRALHSLKDREYYMNIESIKPKNNIRKPRDIEDSTIDILKKAIESLGLSYNIEPRYIDALESMAPLKNESVTESKEMKLYGFMVSSPKIYSYIKDGYNRTLNEAGFNIARKSIYYANDKDHTKIDNIFFHLALRFYSLDSIFINLTNEMENIDNSISSEIKNESHPKNSSYFGSIDAIYLYRIFDANNALSQVDSWFNILKNTRNLYIRKNMSDLDISNGVLLTKTNLEITYSQLKDVYHHINFLSIVFDIDDNICKKNLEIINYNIYKIIYVELYSYIQLGKEKNIENAISIVKNDLQEYIKNLQAFKSKIKEKFKSIFQEGIAENTLDNYKQKILGYLEFERSYILRTLISIRMIASIKLGHKKRLESIGPKYLLYDEVSDINILSPISKVKEVNDMLRENVCKLKELEQIAEEALYETPSYDENELTTSIQIISNNEESNTSMNTTLIQGEASTTPVADTNEESASYSPTEENTTLEQEEASTTVSTTIQEEAISNEELEENTTIAEEEAYSIPVIVIEEESASYSPTEEGGGLGEEEVSTVPDITIQEEITSYKPSIDNEDARQEKISTVPITIAREETTLQEKDSISYSSIENNTTPAQEEASSTPATIVEEEAISYKPSEEDTTVIQEEVSATPTTIIQEESPSYETTKADETIVQEEASTTPNTTVQEEGASYSPTEKTTTLVQEEASTIPTSIGEESISYSPTEESITIVQEKASNVLNTSIEEESISYSPTEENTTLMQEETSTVPDTIIQEEIEATNTSIIVDSKRESKESTTALNTTSEDEVYSTIPSIVREEKPTTQKNTENSTTSSTDMPKSIETTEDNLIDVKINASSTSSKPRDEDTVTPISSSEATIHENASTSVADSTSTVSSPVSEIQPTISTTTLSTSTTQTTVSAINETSTNTTKKKTSQKKHPTKKKKQNNRRKDTPKNSIKTTTESNASSTLSDIPDKTSDAKKTLSPDQNNPNPLPTIHEDYICLCYDE